MIVSKGIGRLWLCVAVLICATATPVLLDAAEPAASDLRQRLDSLQQQIEANSSALEKGRIELQRVSFNEGSGPKDPRAENVRLIEMPKTL